MVIFHRFFYVYKRPGIHNAKLLGTHRALKLTTESPLFE
jgi:hypothetical protein